MNPKTPRYGHSPVRMRRVDGQDRIEKCGDFAWDVDLDESGNPHKIRHIEMAIPRPVSDDPDAWLFVRLPAREGNNERGKWWGWDGNEDAPTLTPSVHTMGHWHGWIRAGQMVEA